MKSTIPVDQQYQHSMQHFEVAPPPAAWEGIVARLPQQKSRRALWIWLAAGAASVTIVVGLLDFSTLFDIREPALQLAGSKMHELQMSEAAKAAAGTVTTEKEKVLIPSGALAETTAPTRVDLEHPATPAHWTAHRHAESLPALAMRSVGFDVRFNHTAVAKALKGSVEESEKRAYTRMLLADAAPVAPIESSSRRIRYQVAGVANSAYASPTSSNGSLRTVESDEQGRMSMGGGLALRLQTSPRWSFETGVHYGRVGQKERATGSQPIVLTAADRSPGLDIAGNHRNSMGQLKVTAGAQPAMDNNFISSNTRPISGFTGDVLQHLDYVEIPFLARYRLWNHALWSVAVSAGMSANVLADNNAYVVNGRNKTRIGYTESIDPFVLSTSLGVSLEVPLSRTFSVLVEPRMKYFVTSLNESFGYQPLELSVQAGLGIRF